MMSRLLSVCVLCAYLFLVNARELPSQFKVCKQDDPDINKCFVEGIKTGIIEATKGVPELGVETIDPLTIDSLTVGEINNQIGLKQIYRDMQIIGLRNTKILDLKGDLESCNFNIKTQTPELHLLSDYTVEGQLLIVPLNGEGKANITLVDIPGSIQIKCKKFQKNSETYYKFTKFGFRINPKNASLDFTNLFKGNAAVSANLNQFINENWKEIFTEVVPEFERSLSKKMLNIANKFVDGIPYNKLFV